MKPTPIVLKLANIFASQLNEMQAWFSEKMKEAPLAFYSSIDIRDAGFKVAPVDSNLYPAGFNNLCPDDQVTAPDIIKRHIQKQLEFSGLPENANRVLILPESHTANLYYLENLFQLKKLIEKSGFEVALGWYGSLPKGFTSPFSLKSFEGNELHINAIEIKGGVLSAGSFIPDLILLNNDFSSGHPSDLDVVTQPIIPSHYLGWHTRKKTEHFNYYNQFAIELATLLNFDPWLITILTKESGPVNFNEGEGLEAVALATGELLKEIQANYLKYKVDHKANTFVKNNSGTYGMGILSVESSQEILQMNRRTKNKMSVGKNKLPIQSVAIQEGIPSVTRIDNAVAEPVIYLMGCELIGGFFRTNPEKTDSENLNSTGMVFKKMCMSDLRQFEASDSIQKAPAFELVYGTIARLSALATAKELKNHRPLNQI